MTDCHGCKDAIATGDGGERYNGQIYHHHCAETLRELDETAPYPPAIQARRPELRSVWERAFERGTREDA
jgi:hypothetical protein